MKKVESKKKSKKRQIDKRKGVYSLDECIYGILKIYLDILIKNFPKENDIILFYSYITFYYMENCFKALFEVMKISKESISLSQNFQLFW